MVVGSMLRGGGGEGAGDAVGGGSWICDFGQWHGGLEGLVVDWW